MEDISFSGISIARAGCAVKIWAQNAVPMNDLKITDLTANAETALLLNYPDGAAPCGMRLRDVTVRGLENYAPDAPERTGKYPFLLLKNIALTAENVRLDLSTSRQREICAETLDGITIVKG